MSRGKRYNDEPKLNVKKVIAVIILLAVIIMFVFAIQKILKTNSGEQITSTNYFTVYTNEKWGVINSKGEIVIEPQYNEIIVIPDNTKPVFICTYDVNYENNTYKTKVLNEKNKEIFKEYEKVEPIYNYDESNNLWYDTNVLKVQKSGLYGLANYNGKQILECNYDNIESLKGVQNSIIIKKEDKIGIADNVGNIIVPVEYKEVKSIENNYKYGYIVINNENQYGIIDVNKKQILECNYEEIKPIYTSNKYIVKENGKYKIIDKDKNIILDTGFDDITEINGDNITIIKDGKYGVITVTGEEKIQTKYDSLKYAFGDYYIAKENNQYGIVDINNKEKLNFNYTSITYRKEEGIIEAEKEESIETELFDINLDLKLTGIISEVNNVKGYIKVRVGDEYKYYNFKFEEKSNTEILNNELFLSKKDGKYGYIDKNGKVIIDYIYDDATELNNYGYAAIKKNGMWGVIDKKGKVLVEPKYELGNNLKIDFIGKWHIGEDLNSNYYTDM